MIGPAQFPEDGQDDRRNQNERGRVPLEQRIQQQQGNQDEAKSPLGPVTGGEQHRKVLISAQKDAQPHQRQEPPPAEDDGPYHEGDENDGD